MPADFFIKMKYFTTVSCLINRSTSTNRKEKQLERQYFEHIFRKYKDTVYRIAAAYCKNRSDADDISQDVFVILYTSRIDFEADENCKAWLIRVTVNRSINLLKSRYYRKSEPLNENLTYDAVTAETAEESELLCAVRALSPKYRAVIHLYYYEDCSVKEFSEILGIKQSTVQSQLMRGRAILKKYLKGKYDYEE